MVRPAWATYLLTHDGMGVLVDPQRDIERSTSLADANGAQIRYTLDTHLHNDYISGGPDVARATGAELRGRGCPAGSVTPHPPPSRSGSGRSRG